MDKHDKINRYDLVEIIQVPEKLQGVIDLGDIGVVVEKYDQENFEIECVTPDGSYKWLQTLNVRYISKHLRSSSRRRKSSDAQMMRNSVVFGSLIGAGVGIATGCGLGAITGSFQGILIGSVIGLMLGLVTGALTAAATVKTAGTTGGVGVGYYTGMLVGGILGMTLGALVPTSLRLGAHTEALPVLDALAQGRFETAILTGFFLSILATIVGVWIGGRNHVPRHLKNDRS
jgi:hypothetical protein